MKKKTNYYDDYQLTQRLDQSSQIKQMSNDTQHRRLLRAKWRAPMSQLNSGPVKVVNLRALFLFYQGNVLRKPKSFSVYLKQNFSCVTLTGFLRFRIISKTDHTWPNKSPHCRQSSVSRRPSTLSQTSMRDVGNYNVTKVRRQSVSASMATNQGSNV